MSAPGTKADVPPSAHEMTIGQGFPSPNQPDKRRIATYRAGLGPDLWWDARCVTVVGNRGWLCYTKVTAVFRPAPKAYVEKQTYEAAQGSRGEPGEGAR